MFYLVYFRQAKIFPIFRNVQNYLLTPTAKFIHKVMIENIKQSFSTGKTLMVGTRRKFKLEKENDNTYAIRHTEAGNLDVGKTYEIQVSGKDDAGNVQKSLVILRVCRLVF